MKQLLNAIDKFRTIKYYGLTINENNCVVADKNNTCKLKISYWCLVPMFCTLCASLFMATWILIHDIGG